MDLAQQCGLTNLSTFSVPDFVFQTRACGTSTRQRRSYQREDMRDAPRPCATRDCSSTFSEEGDWNDQLLWQCAQLATHSDVGRTWAVVREDSKLLSIDPLFDLPRTCEHVPAFHSLHIKLPQTVDVSPTSKPRATDVRRHSWSHNKKHRLKQKRTELNVQVLASHGVRKRDNENFVHGDLHLKTFDLCGT